VTDPLGALAGRRVMVPETRELDVLAQMLERHGAVTIRCPLVAIRDAPDAAPVVALLQRFVDAPPDDLVLMTGEGLGRLAGFAQRASLEAGFVAALGQVRKITRGPKPVRRLRMLGLDADLHAEPATTAGIIAALSGEDLRGRRIALALYPDDPHEELLAFLRRKGATADPVLAYAYGSAAEDAAVVDVIDQMAAGRVDFVTFTSTPQVRRLQQVAKAHRREAALLEGLRRTTIAAVGPVVGRAIELAGGHVAIAPAENFHMKPMVNAIIAAIAQESGPGAENPQA
jgi:uroporphyrinogen-III synthase